MKERATPKVWRDLAKLTPARIALGRAGAALPTSEVLRFALDHARARDAVHAKIDSAAISTALGALGFSAVEAESAAADRATYLRRPDLGRQLSDASRERLMKLDRPPVDIVFVVGDGLSAAATDAHAVRLLEALKPSIAKNGWSVAPVVVAHETRVALGDEIGEIFNARIAVVILGERPGLSSADSLGVYLTFGPKHGRVDADRNCISNIRPEGLSYERAAFKLAWHLSAALRLGLSGVGLKDESDARGLLGS